MSGETSAAKVIELGKTAALEELFPLSFSDNSLSSFIAAAHAGVAKNQRSSLEARVPGKFGRVWFRELVARYSDLPEEVSTPAAAIIESMSQQLLAHAPRWRSPWLQYNIGTAPNAAAVAMYAAALDENMININEGNAGNALVAEEAVSAIMLRLAQVEGKGAGLFTFGGTGTNLYAVRVGVLKSDPDVIKHGVRNDTVVFITEDAHFSHHSVADWTGIGRDRLLVMPSARNRQTDLGQAEALMRKALSEGKRIGCILINGGTTYWHTIDPIRQFVELRERLCTEYKLNYVPHIHVDAVIGWAWLMFEGYDFDENPLHITGSSLSRIREQYRRVSDLRLADSWGIDFHKGIGGSPVDTSMVIFNKREDLAYLAKSGNIEGGLHQLAQDEDYPTPSEYTLETSRSSGPALSALAALHTVGKRGYQQHLATLIESADVFRRVLLNERTFALCHPDDMVGFASMVRLYPLKFSDDYRRQEEITGMGDEYSTFTKEVNSYVKAFFEWDYKTRMLQGRGVEYSFSKCCLISKAETPVSALKVYPTSPHFNEQHAEEAAQLLIEQKRIFDSTVWERS